MESTVGEAIRMGFAGLGRERWLVAVGLLTALLRRLLWLPAVAVGLLILLRGAWRAHDLAPFSGPAPALGAVWVGLQPRVVALVLGLALGAGLLAWLVRLAYVAGALPTLAGAMGPPESRGPRFGAGVAWGLPRLLPTAVLGLALEWTGQLFLAGIVLAALRVSAVAVTAVSGRVALAAAVAAGLVVAILVALLTSAIADAALVRTAVRGDGPVEALLEASSRVLARPAAYLMAVLAFAVLSLAATAAVQSFGGLATGFAHDVPAVLALGPALMLWVLAATAAAALELWWLASLTVLSSREG